MKWLNRIFHWHNWVQVSSMRGTSMINGKDNGTAFLIIEGCQCGTERAYIDRGTSKSDVSVSYAKKIMVVGGNIQTTGF